MRTWHGLLGSILAVNASGCRQVHERVYPDNQLVREQIREVC